MVMHIEWGWLLVLAWLLYMMLSDVSIKSETARTRESTDVKFVVGLIHEMKNIQVGQN